jgi:hypothetical protein
MSTLRFIQSKERERGGRARRGGEMMRRSGEMMRKTKDTMRTSGTNIRWERDTHGRRRNQIGLKTCTTATHLRRE